MEAGILNSITWPAPAKINLFLHIIGRRPDGYHLLQTAFQFLDLVDQLHYACRDDGRINLSANYQLKDGNTDLNVRAARALQHASGTRLGVDISVEKIIPMGGGLGGGSSNAATTLVALNYLWQLELSTERLVEVGLSLGADVPVFIHGHAAWAEGIGELLTDIAPEEGIYLVIYPGYSVSTAEIFADEDLTRHTPPITIRDFLDGKGHNDCEPVVRRHYPEVDAAMRWLDGHANACMTGTGACVFARFSHRSEAETVLHQLPNKWVGFITSALNQSPLLLRLAQEQQS